MDNKGYPKVHGDYLAAQKDMARLYELLEQTKGRYKRELKDAAYLPFQTRLVNWLISLISFGLAHPSEQEVEVENKKNKIHKTYCDLIDKIEKEIAQVSVDLPQIAALNQKVTISIKHGIGAGGYPSNWEEISRSVRERDGYHCRYPGCGGTGLILHVHHVIPLSQGGSNTLSNLVTLCEKHHIAKHPHMRR